MRAPAPNLASKLAMTTAALFLMAPAGMASAGAAGAQTAADSALKQSIHQDFDAHLAAIFDDFHRNPELSGMETRTSAPMAALLTELGYEVVTGVEAMTVSALALLAKT